MNRIQPDDIEIHFGLPPGTFEWDYVSIDSEFFGQNKEMLHRPHGRFACVGCTFNGKDVYMIFDEKQIQKFYERIDKSTHIYHHAQYDIKQLRRFADIPDRKMIWDTMIVEQIRFNGYYDSFALKDLARRYLGIYMDKSERETFSDEDATEMTEDQIFYAAVDIVCTYMVGMQQMVEIDEDDSDLWKHVEMPFLWTLLDTGGITLDVDKWTNRYEKDLKLAQELNDKLPFNPRSHVQVKEFFKTNYNLTLESTAEKVLLEVAKEYPDIQELQMILDARGAAKSASTYGLSWVDAVEEDGKFYPSWHQIGAKTGRMSAGRDKDDD